MANAQARRLIQVVQNQLAQMDGSLGVAVDEAAVRASAQDSLGKLDRLVAQIREGLNSERSEKRAVGARKVGELEEQARFLRHALDQHSLVSSRAMREQRDREALMGGADGGNGGGFSQSLLQEGASLKRSSHMVREMQEMGQIILGSLHEQGGALKAAQRRLLDVASSVGLSNALLRVIERREMADKVIVYGGMVVTLLVLWGCVALVSS